MWKHIAVMLDIIAVLELNHVYIYIHNIYISLHTLVYTYVPNLYIYKCIHIQSLYSKFQPRSNLRLVMLVLQNQAVNRRDVGADTYPI